MGSPASASFNSLAGQRFDLAVEQRLSREGSAVARSLGLAGRILGSAFRERSSPLIFRRMCSGHRTILLCAIDQGSAPS
jgi:hypothetical protein